MFKNLRELITSRKYASDYVGLSPEQVKEYTKTHPMKSKGVVIGMKQREGKAKVISKATINRK